MNWRESCERQIRVCIKLSKIAEGCGDQRAGVRKRRGGKSGEAEFSSGRSGNEKGKKISKRSGRVYFGEMRRSAIIEARVVSQLALCWR
jgi:hypothetical protein